MSIRRFMEVLVHTQTIGGNSPENPVRELVSIYDEEMNLVGQCDDLRKKSWLNFEPPFELKKLNER